MLTTPYRCGTSLEPEAFALVRRSLVLDHCKWDPQVGDVATLAPFPLLMAPSAWRELAESAEQLSAEAAEAERELATKPELLRHLLPRRLRQALTESGARPVVAAPRAFRYDFHWTTAGWRISECNADVPGGYAEASAFPALMAAHCSSAEPAGDPGRVWAEALARSAGSKGIALLSAPGFMEDQQVIRYLAQRIEQCGISAQCAQPEQIEWRAGRARLQGRELGAIFRFYQAEWIAALPRATEWWRYFGAGETPVSNPSSCIPIESKRFPLIWGALSTRLPAWRRLLPHSVDPREAPWQRDDAWLLKTALCNTGDTVSARSLLPPAHWKKVARAVRFFPGDWVAQERFEALPLETPIGPVFPCIGVYTIDGRTAGAYVRLSRGPVVDFAAIDAALLLEETRDVAHA